MKRIISILLLTTLLLCGCTGEAGIYVPTGNGLVQDETTQPTTQPAPPQPQSVTLGYYPEKSLNPYEATEISHKLIFSLVYQGLFTIDRDYNVSPILCKNFSVSKDMRTYVFYPAEATFFDGTALTAADIAASLEAARAGTVYSGRLRQISTVSVTEDGGVQVVLRTPYENLPLLLDVPIVKAAETGAERPMGTGPYGYDTGLNGLQLKRCGNWWCRANLAVTAPIVSLLEVDSPATMRDDFEYGNISIVCADPGSDTYVDYRCDYELWDVESGVFLFLACNKRSQVFSNKALRVALTHAIDRDALVMEYYRGFAQSAYMPASPDSPRYDPNAEEKAGYDPELFTQALADAALENMAITLLVNKADSRRVKVARSIGKMLEGYGFTVTISALSGNSYTNALKNNKFDLHLGQTKLSANMDLTEFFRPYGEMSRGGLQHETIYSMCLNALENNGNYYNLYQKLVQDGRVIPVMFGHYNVYAERGLMPELEPSRDNVFYYSLGKTMEGTLIEETYE